jgi:hypothetical protein
MYGPGVYTRLMLELYGISLQRVTVGHVSECFNETGNFISDAIRY